MIMEMDANSRSSQETIPHWYDPESEPLEVDRAAGVHVYDPAGNEYLDFLSQLYCVNAGHDNRAIIDAMVEQLERVPYVSSSKGTPVRDELADKLGEITPDSLSDVFLSVSGSEANEIAIQFAREYTGASTVLTRWRSYHGSTYGAGSLTGDPETRSVVEAHAATTGAAKFLPPMSYRSPFNADSPEDLADLAADHLDFVIRNEGPDSVAAILTEPIAGTSGAYTAPPGYFQRVRELCDEYDILLIADEVITGFGRCGDWFGMQTEDVEPDLITFAKGVTSAYAPLAGVIARPEITEHVHENGFDLGQTFGGHPIACAAANAAIDEYADGIIENVNDNEAAFERQLAELETHHEVIGDIRGRGYLWAVEFTDPSTGKPFHDPRVDEGENPVSAVASAAQERGLLVGSGRPGIQLLLAPPLTATSDDIATAIEALDGAIGDVFG